MLGASNGSGFQASTNGTAEAQQDTAYQQTQSGIAQQQSFVNALNAQNGLGNQSSVFQQQQGLANQLQNIGNGQGPNPAQAQLAQNTAANTANQAALMAGQRGASQNTGLIARQAAMQGAQNQQNSVGQAATLGAQQQLAALQQLQNQQSSMGNLANTQVGQQQQGLQGLNQASLQQQGNLLGAQANQNDVNSRIAGGNQGGQQNIVGGIMGGAGSALQLIPGLGAEGGVVKMAGGGMPGMQANPLMQPIGQQSVSQLNPAGAGSGPQSNVGRAMSSGMSPGFGNAVQTGNNIGSGLIKAGKYMFGQGAGMQSDEEALQGYADADRALGVAGYDNPEVMMPTATEGSSGMASGATTTFGGESAAGALGGGGAGEALGVAGEGIAAAAPEIGAGIAAAAPEIGAGIAAAAPAIGEGLMDIAPLLLAAAKGGRVPALLSPGERYLKPDQAKKVAEGKASPMKEGKKVPGKPKVAGAKNSYKNDTVKANLQEGGIVIPRSITMGKDAPEKAAAFVRACMAKSGSLPKRGK